MIYNAVLVSTVQQSDSNIQITIIFQILFHVGYYRVLSRVPSYTVGSC